MGGRRGGGLVCFVLTFLGFLFYLVVGVFFALPALFYSSSCSLTLNYEIKLFALVVIFTLFNTEFFGPPEKQNWACEF